MTLWSLGSNQRRWHGTLADHNLQVMEITLINTTCRFECHTNSHSNCRYLYPTSSFNTWIFKPLKLSSICLLVGSKFNDLITIRLRVHNSKLLVSLQRSWVVTTRFYHYEIGFKYPNIITCYIWALENYLVVAKTRWQWLMILVVCL